MKAENVHICKFEEMSHLMYICGYLPNKLSSVCMVTLLFMQIQKIFFFFQIVKEKQNKTKQNLLFVDIFIFYFFSLVLKI